MCSVLVLLFVPLSVFSTSIHLSACPSAHPSVHLPIIQSAVQSIGHLTAHSSINLPSIHPFIYPPIHLSCDLGKLFQLSVPQLSHLQNSLLMTNISGSCGLKRTSCNVPDVTHPFCGVAVVVVALHVRLCNPMDCSLPGSSVHGILQARILERTAIPSSRGSSQPRDRTWVSCITGRFFTI